MNIISPVLVFAGTLITIIINVRNNSNKINADLKAQSRIQWIQDVRKISSNLINAHYELLDCKNESDAVECLTKIRRLTTLFSLYFSYLKNSKSGFYLVGEYYNKIEYSKNNELLLKKLLSNSNDKKIRLLWA